MSGRDYVAPDDVKAVAVAALAHRLIVVDATDRAAAVEVVRSALGQVPVPRG
jgi:MoxR-like ATPase